VDRAAGAELIAATPLGDVSDTARWVAFFRALESERPDALFRDPFARRLAGDRGRAIAESLPSGPLSWSLAVRTRVFDELILDAVGDGARVVVNLGAGLDTRPYRLPLPAGVRWIEVDSAGILDLKKDALAGERPACALEQIALDVADPHARRALWAALPSPADRVLVVTEGILVYLEPEQVASLARDLRAHVPGALWILENASPEILARQRRLWGTRLEAARAEHKFAPAEGLAFFRPHGWSPRTIRSLLDEARRLGREMPMAWLMRVAAALAPRRHDRFRQAVVYALLEPARG
jgi:methyltransferase (TIGR00027 family)